MARPAHRTLAAARAPKGIVNEVAKDIALTGVIATGLALFLLGIHTEDAPDALVLTPRPWLLASAASIVMACRCVLHLLHWWPTDPHTRVARFGIAALMPLLPLYFVWRLLQDPVETVIYLIAFYIFAGALLLLRYATGDDRHQRWADAEKKLTDLWDRVADWLGAAMVAFACLLPFLPFTDRYILDVSIMVLTYVMLWDGA